MNDYGTIELPAETVAVSAEADVVVVGGGTSGFIAATAAGRAGAKVILLERFGYLGGCTTAPYNTTLGLYFDSDGNHIIKGLGWEFVERMIAEGEGYDMRPHSPQIWPPTTKKIALEMIEEAGVDLYFYTWVSDVVMDGDRVDGVVVLNKGGRSVIRAKTFVDATGDADLAAFAGAPFEMTELENLQQVSADFIACGVDATRVYEWAKENKDKLKNVSGLEFEHFPDGRSQHMLSFVIPNPDTTEGYHVGVMPTVKLCVYRDSVRLQGNADIDPLDPKALTYAETSGLRGAMAHLAHLKQNVPGFEHAHIVSQTHLGVRETRRIVGDYFLTIDDLRNQARFDDVVALNCRALDYHLPGTRFQIEFLKGNHDIPLRALLPQGVANLLVTGRSISGDHLSQASLRGAATAMATGQAAGVAAAVARSHGGIIRETPIGDIQQALLAQGVVLGTGVRANAFQSV